MEWLSALLLAQARTFSQKEKRQRKTDQSNGKMGTAVSPGSLSFSWTC